MYRITKNSEGKTITLKPVDKAEVDTHLNNMDAFSRNQIESSGFEPKFGKWIPIFNRDGVPEEIWVGTDSPPSDPRIAIQLFARLSDGLPKGHAYSVDAEDWPEGLDWDQAALGWGLAAYHFDHFREKKERRPGPFLVVPESVDVNSLEARLAAVFLARDLINLPPNVLGPKELCDRALEIGATHEASVTVTEGTDLLEQNYPAIYAVGKGSYREPALIDLRWGEESHPKLTLVGKGVIFDSGGLNLKPAGGMLLMKKDMGGAAVTLALAQLIMARKLPVRLRLLIPAVENSPGRFAYRPGDVIETRKGISVEIGNTDAEGRIILCDALYDAATEKPDMIIDMATLTGAARIALGQDLPAFFTPDDQIARELMQAASEVADPVWRMPLWHPYRKMMDSRVADINNVGNSAFAGSVTAALYLHEFVKPFRNWIHVDMYGWRNDHLPGAPKGGEANAIRALYRFLETRYRG